ncbi:MAG: phosphoadenylyl-sulfate reductase [Deltaproteobacteria bacterium]
MSTPSKPPLSSDAIEGLNRRFEQSSPEQILGWAAATFPTDIILTCSFQHDGVVIAHMLRSIAPEIPVVFINTGFHFQETLDYRDDIVKLLKLDLREIGPQIPFEQFKDRYGADLYNRNPDLCCEINKVGPMRRALEGVEAWINGRRRNQTRERKNIGHLELMGSVVKINPLARWTSKDTFRYLNAHNLPTHPLFEKGYTSIGCQPCTGPPLAGEDERSGRWAGSNKRECGIHTILDGDPATTDKSKPDE